MSTRRVHTSNLKLYNSYGENVWEKFIVATWMKPCSGREAKWSTINVQRTLNEKLRSSLLGCRIYFWRSKRNISLESEKNNNYSTTNLRQSCCQSMFYLTDKQQFSSQYFDWRSIILTNYGIGDPTSQAHQLRQNWNTSAGTSEHSDGLSTKNYVKVNKNKWNSPGSDDLAGGKLPSNLSTRKVTGRLMSQDKKNRNSFPLISAKWLRN